MNRDILVSHLDEYLRISEIRDKADNGLQVEGAIEINRVAFAVDACLEAFRRADETSAQMLVCHHGLFWGEPMMLRGVHRQRVGYLLQRDISLYAVHLPLDVHPEVGHNVQLARLLGLQVTGSFGDYHGILLGVLAEAKEEISLNRLVKDLEDGLNTRMTVLKYGPEKIKHVGIISGGAASLVDQAADAGVDLYVTGEASHGAFHQIAERQLNVVYGGHYATETLGLKALAEHLTDKYQLETEFYDIPTGF
jgi:dinuclear metal center YbgI/SA1388 family protein